MFPPTTTQIPGCKIPVTATHCPVAGGIPRARLSEGRGFPGPGRAGSAAALPTPGLPHVHPCTISFPCIPVSCTGSSACFTIWLIFLKTCHQGRQQPLGVLPPDIAAAVRCCGSIHALVDSVLEHLCTTQAVAEPR